MIQILDSTLREGEQTPGVTFTLKEKLEIAHLLDDFGVDFIEAGHPAVSKDVRCAVKTIANEGLNASILAHSRAMRSDIDMALDCDVEWIGLFISVLEDRLKLHFKKDLDQVCCIVEDAVQYAKDHGLKVRYTPEDTIRSHFESVVKVSKVALNAGADRISVADTVGAATPGRIGTLIRNLIDRTGAEVNVHCHNDIGLALANSLAAYENGAILVDVCVNGLGERAGITSLAELVMALKVHYGVDNGWKLDMLPALSDRVEELSGLRVASNAPIVGENAFAHNAGLHVSAALLKPSFYEIFSAETVGRTRRFELDKLSGRDLVGDVLTRGGISLNECQMSDLMVRIKSREKGNFTEEEILGSAMGSLEGQ
ncbi:MAG: homocitrate synthase [Candidatus Thermoplasmatota archaeon]|nr:homocitrate synthase [Candidatus Thermoplasmatota archaeon]